MKILFALTYFRPHVSGLTIYVDRLSRALARLGHEVTVLTSQYQHELPLSEQIDGVEIIRVPVAFRLSKGVVMPSFGRMATEQVKKNDVLSLHLPQFDAAGIAVRGRMYNKPTVLTYHCDLRLPGGFVNFVANQAVNAANRVAARSSHRIVAYTDDYAEHSPFISTYLEKVEVIPPPVEIAPLQPEILNSLRTRRKHQEGPVIGMAARVATEKGVEYLLGGLPKILSRHPNAEVFFAGQHEHVLGEANYMKRLEPMLERFHEHWTFLGVLSPAEMTAFYHLCDVTVLPSINSTESFGLVQIESMLCGTPVVASNLPGVRHPVLSSGMGEVVPLKDSDAIASAILEILESPERYQVDRSDIESTYLPSATGARYEDLFQRLRHEIGEPSAS
jgi:glycosyltransferase involved in cell wall biosynthesis